MTPVGIGWWLAPDNQIYEVENTHWGWIQDNKSLLETKYNIDVSIFDEYSYGGYGNIECNLLVEKDWLQIRLYKKKLTVYLKDLSFINKLINFINNFNIEFNFIIIYEGDNYETYDKQEFINKFNNIIKKSSLEDYMGSAWWLAPDNQLYEIPLNITHWAWVKMNMQTLRQKYDIKPTDSGLPEFIAKGWIRIRIYRGNLHIDINNKNRLVKVIDFLYNNDVIKNVNGILNIKDIFVDLTNGQRFRYETREFLKKFSNKK